MVTSFTQNAPAILQRLKCDFILILQAREDFEENEQEVNSKGKIRKAKTRNVFRFI